MAISDLAFDALRDRVTKVEEKQAVREETLKNIEIRLGKIEGTLSRLTWMMIIAIGSAALAFVLHGGLYVATH